MSTSNSGKIVLATPSGIPIPQLVKHIERLVHEGKPDDVKKILMNIEQRTRLGIGSVVKMDPDDIRLEEKLQKSEKEREHLKMINSKLVEKMKGLIDRTTKTDKILCELTGKVSANDQALSLYQEKIKFFDLALRNKNMEYFRLWEMRSEAAKINQQMRCKLNETLQSEERLRCKLVESGVMIEKLSRDNFETKVAMERMKRKAPETGEGVEELKEARRAVEILNRQNIEATIAIKRLKTEKSEADKVLQVHKNWFGTLAPLIKNVGVDLGTFLNEKVSVQPEIGNSFGASGSGGSGLRV